MHELNKFLTFKDILLINLCDIFGAGLFAIFSSTLLQGGTNIIWAFIVTTISCIISGLVYAEIISIYGTNISEITILKDIYGKYYGNMMAYLMAFLELLIASTIMIALSKYIFKSNRFLGILLSFTIITTIFIINYYGIELSTLVINTITIIMIILLIFIILYGYLFSNVIITKKTSNKFSKKQTGLYGFFVCCTFIIFLFTGFDSVAKIHDEIKHEEIDKIPNCITLSIIIVAVIYILLTLLITRIFNDEDIKDDFLTIPLLYKILIGNTGFVITYIIGILIVIGSIITILLTTSRYMHGLSKDNILPEIMSELNEYKTPTLILLLSYIICIIFIFIDNEKLAMNLSNIFVFIILVSTNFALVIYRFYDYNQIILKKNNDGRNINNKDINKQYKMPGYINNIPILPIINSVFLSILLFVCFTLF